jgi:hypothetical protein
MLTNKTKDEGKSMHKKQTQTKRKERKFGNRHIFHMIMYVNIKVIHNEKLNLQATGKLDLVE